MSVNDRRFASITRTVGINYTHTIIKRLVVREALGVAQ
jgi:hypothetical protein